MAEALGKSLEEVRDWPVEDLTLWAAYFSIRGEERKARSKARNL